MSRWGRLVGYLAAVVLAWDGIVAGTELSVTGLSPDFDNSGEVDFNDFFILADQFDSDGTSTELDGIPGIGYGDFFIFADNFGRTAAQVVLPDPPGPGPGPYANAGATFGVDLHNVVGVGPNQSIAIRLAGVGLTGVTQYAFVVELSPAEAFDLDAITFAGVEGTVSPGVERLGPSRFRFGGAALGGEPLNSIITLMGTLTVRTASTFSSQSQANVTVLQAEVGPNSTQTDVLTDLNQVVFLNTAPAVTADWGSHERGAAFPGEPVKIHVGFSASVSSVTAIIHPDGAEGPATSVPLADDGVGPDRFANDRDYGGWWSGAPAPGWYFVDVAYYDNDGFQRRNQIDALQVAHTILSVPNQMLVSPEQVQNCRIPILLEDDGEGYLSSRGFLSLHFGAYMHRSEPHNGVYGIEPTAATIDTAGSLLAPVSGLWQFSSRQEPIEGWSALSRWLDGAVASADSVHLNGGPGPSQAVLAYLNVEVEPQDPSHLFLNPVTALFDEDQLGVQPSCCSSMSLGRGDVDTSATIDSYDASLVLMHVVGKLDLNDGGNPANDWVEEEQHFILPYYTNYMADASGVAGITAYDAALILRRSVGAITHFPSEEGYYRLWDPPQTWWNPPLSMESPKPVAAAAVPSLDRTVSLGAATEGDGLVCVPVQIDQMAGIVAGSLTLGFDPQALRPAGVRTTLLTAGFLVADHPVGDQLRVSFAGAASQPGSGSVVELLFERLAPAEGGVTLTQAQLNEGEVQVRLQQTGAQVQSLPLQARLHANYPNPFNPQTTLRYELPAEGPVRLAIYSLSGQLVRVLVEGRQPAGSRQASWDGRDDRGEPVASGVYLCRLETPQAVLLQKMVLVK